MSRDGTARCTGWVGPLAAALLAASVFVGVQGVAGGTAVGGTAVESKVAGAGQPARATVPAGAEPNEDREFIQVYDANVENLPTSGENSPPQCAGDWHDLMYFMRKQPLKPDVYLVQQLNDKAQLDRLLERMESHFGEEYEGVLAENAPEPAKPGHGGECERYKARQTNGVIWRADRFEALAPTWERPGNRWQAQAAPDGGKCENNTQARTKGIKALLHDKVSGKRVTAASFHWPTKKSEGSPCAVSNAAELSNELGEGDFATAGLVLAGGDSNYRDSSTPGDGKWSEWYAGTNGDLPGSTHGFRDAVYFHCAASGDLKGCLEDRLTLEEKQIRIDYLLARKGDAAGGTLPGTSQALVPHFWEGDEADVYFTGTDNEDLDYSDHRAVGARIHY